MALFIYCITPNHKERNKIIYGNVANLSQCQKIRYHISGYKQNFKTSQELPMPPCVTPLLVSCSCLLILGVGRMLKTYCVL